MRRSFKACGVHLRIARVTLSSRSTGAGKETDDSARFNLFSLDVCLYFWIYFAHTYMQYNYTITATNDKDNILVNGCSESGNAWKIMRGDKHTMLPHVIF